MKKRKTVCDVLKKHLAQVSVLILDKTTDCEFIDGF